MGHVNMIQTNTNVEYIYSQLGEDPDFGDIVEMFAKEMPGRVETMLDCLNREDWEGLRRNAHQLKGAAGSYGFEPLSPCANRVEYAIKNGEPQQRIREAVMELVDLCSRVRCGQPTR